MALVDYSDSDASETEEQPIAKSAAPPSKSGFRKVVDRSNPGKITVSLPQSTTARGSTHEDVPQAKRLKTSGGAFSGFNSFLPAPKRTAPPTVTTGGGTIRGGLGAGINLKTGATPAFNRESESGREPDPAAQSMHSSQSSAKSNLPSAETSDSLVQIPADEVKLVGKPLMFRPLSVVAKPKKKKPTSAVSNTRTATSRTIANPAPETPVPPAKVSLFSIGIDSEKLPISTSNGDYTPIMIREVLEGQDDDESPDQSSLTPSYEDYTPNTSFSGHLPPVPTPPVSQSLDDIAGDLNLSAAEKRQLFGRQKGSRGQAATKIINFNTDQEYLHNEQLRAAGEQVSHNPVRAIAPGKHSLKQLVNAAQSQKEALEESFAKGKNNRAEASSRYGW